MIRLTPADLAEPTHPFDLDRARYPLLEFIPCTRVDVHLGPPLKIEVPGHGTDELAPAILSAVEKVVGCSLVAEDVPEAAP